MVTFDGVNKLIIMDHGVTDLSVKNLYSYWKQWMQTGTNSGFAPAFTVVGGDPTTGSNVITPYFFLSNGWKIRPYEGNHTLKVDGILITDDDSDPFVDTIGAFRVGIQSIVPIYTESVLLETGVSGLTPEESAQLAQVASQGVSVDTGAVASAVWENSTRTLTEGGSGGLDEAALHTGLDNYANKDDWKAESVTATIDANDIWTHPTRSLTEGSGLDESELHTALDNYSNKDDFKADLSAIPQQVWEYVSRTLTVDAGLTSEQEEKLDQIITDIAALPEPDQMTEAELHTALDSYANKDAWKESATADLTPVLNAITALNNLSLADIEGSAVVAKEATVSLVQAAVMGLNDVTVNDIRAAFNAADFKDKNTELEIHTWLDSYAGKEQWKDGVTIKEEDKNDIRDKIWDKTI
jgi:hypothetical protein